jgi:hypothetical protein
MRVDAPKFPSVSWDAITFVTGAGDLHEVKILPHATVISGSETPASRQLDLSTEAPAFGIDYYHTFFRDTRHTVAHTDCIKETQLTQDVSGGGETWLYVGSVEGFRAGDWVYIERTGTNEEMVFLLEVDQLQNRLRANVTITHPAGSYVTLRVEGYHIAEKFAGLINDPTTGDTPGRYGPCQAIFITGEGGATGARTGPGDPIGSYLGISFKPDSGYSKLGNLDRGFLFVWISLPCVSGPETDDRGHWSWWRVLLPLWVVLGHNALYLTVGFFRKQPPSGLLMSGRLWLRLAPFRRRRRSVKRSYDPPRPSPVRLPTGGDAVFPHFRR